MSMWLWICVEKIWESSETSWSYQWNVPCYRENRLRSLNKLEINLNHFPKQKNRVLSHSFWAGINREKMPQMWTTSACLVRRHIIRIIAKVKLERYGFECKNPETWFCFIVQSSKTKSLNTIFIIILLSIVSPEFSNEFSATTLPCFATVMKLVKSDMYDLAVR